MTSEPLLGLNPTLFLTLGADLRSSAQKIAEIGDVIS